MQRKVMLPLAVVLMLVLAALGLVNQQALAVHTAAVTLPQWQLQKVETASSVGDCAVTRLDSAGHPLIIYFDAAQKALFFVKYNGSSWSAPVEVDAAQRGHIQCESGMTLQANEAPAVTYSNDTGLLFYAPATCSGGTCSFAPQQVTLNLSQTVPGQNPRYPVIVLNASGAPQIMFYYNTWLIYVDKIGGTWHTEEPKKADGINHVLIGDPVTGGGVPLRVVRDASGNLHLSYYCQKTYTWYLERTAGGTWTVPNRLTTDSNRYGIDIALDTAGNPHIATIVNRPSGFRTLALYSCTAGSCTSAASWTSKDLDALPDTAATSEISGVRLAINSLNFPRLSYYYQNASGTAGLKYLYFDSATTYRTMMVDPRAGVGRHTSLALTPAGNSVISYYEGGAGGLDLATQIATLELNNTLYMPVINR